MVELRSWEWWAAGIVAVAVPLLWYMSFNSIFQNRVTDDDLNAPGGKGRSDEPEMGQRERERDDHLSIATGL